MIKVPVAYRIDPEHDGNILSEFILRFRPRVIPTRWFDYVSTLPYMEGAIKTSKLMQVIREVEL